VPQIEYSVSNYAAGDLTIVQRQHGKAVLVTYLLDSAPDKVTGKVVRDSAERYEFWHGGQEAILTLTGPKGADNVDPWRIVSDSVRWSG
jgi:DNA/RNA-binding domain of Phe-tRNA-synthetase-like protein